ncbi:beta-propeller domains of methanol dehydrogenase [Rufibacter sp. DG15C]|uniref:TPM domain-containing protein n=1 Tax=Rufibacter sp. DG15C TaxID=1379909 RepID=UPI00078E5923|nr:TPM domain-containing protein [Rufibacter sp. DG15C]AMM50857.1 beta-propeller domains of methanol dehydrogenase [Rufibacter sp. DG15C]
MKKYFWLLGLLWITSFTLFAQIQDKDFPPRPTPPRLVNDLADILSPQEEAALEQKLVAYSDSTSTQIAIVNITSIGGYDISDYAFRLGEQWGIGQKDNDNGILILTAVNERKVYIATGYGMEGVLPDAIAKRLTEGTLKPNYQKQQFYQGLDQATTQIITRAAGEYKADPKQQRQGQGEEGIPTLWIIIGIMILIFIISRRGGGGRGGRRGMGGMGGPFIPPIIFGDFSGGRGIFGGGGGGFGGGGGGFGGFGGGSFGGGGAGSDW